MKKLCLFSLSLMILSSTLASAVTKTQIGKPGDWANTIAGAVWNGKIYTVESDGRLYVTGPADGTREPVGKAEFANTAFLFALDNALISIEKDGSLYRIDPTDGSWKRVGKAGDWVNTLAGTFLNGNLYTVESSGKLYVTELATGSWAGLGQAEFANTIFMAAVADKLYTIEKNGGLYEINTTDGTWKSAGAVGGEATAVTVMDGRIYAVGRDGTLYVADPAKSETTALAPGGMAGTRFLFAIGNRLFLLNQEGSLYSMDVSESAPSAEAAPAATQPAPAAAPAVSEALKAGELTFIFQGQWMGDTTTFEQDPNYKTVLASAPDMAKSLLDMIRGVKMKVTLDGITMEVMGEKEGPYKYNIVSAEDNNLLVETTEGPKAGSKANILFLDKNRIRLLGQGDPESRAMFLKRE